MSVSLPISVLVITKDEADRVRYTIESVRDWADEIIVIDSGSADGTQGIARSLSAKVRVIHNDWPGYGPQKVFGERQCANDWLLNLDADEEVDRELQSAIRELFANGAPGCAGFMLRRCMIHFSDDAPRRLAPVRAYLRLYDRRKAGFRDSIVHDSVIVREGEVRPVSRGLLLHRSFRSLDHFRRKLDGYSDLQAQDMYRRGRRPGPLRTLLEPVLAFVRMYVFRRFFIYGRDGIAMSMAYAGIRKGRLQKARALFGAARTRVP